MYIYMYIYIIHTQREIINLVQYCNEIRVVKYILDNR